MKKRCGYCRKVFQTTVPAAPTQAYYDDCDKIADDFEGHRRTCKKRASHWHREYFATIEPAQ